MNGNSIYWLIYALAVLVASAVVGLHLGRFREAYTEMTGMMVGMTMGMLNGFLLGYAAASAMQSMFWGNLIGIALGLGAGAYYGRAGGLMGVMDGSMGGVMGGSMGAMLAAMLLFPVWALNWTGAALVLVYLLGIVGLVVLIERSAPQHAALHRLLPFFTRAVATEAREELQSAAPSASGTLPDYYAFFGIDREAAPEEITEAYLARLAESSGPDAQLAGRAYATLSDPTRRKVYDDSLGPCPHCATRKPTAKQRAKQPEVAATLPVAPVLPAVSSRTRQAAPREKEAPISWVGIVAGLITLGMLGAWWMVSQAASVPGPVDTSDAVAAAPAGASIAGYSENSTRLNEQAARTFEASAVAVPVGADGKQTISFVVNGTQMAYSPRVLKVKRGVPVHFNISVQGQDPGCGRFVGFKGLGIHAIVDLAGTVPLDFTPSKTGVYEINCSMDMMQPGYLFVTD
jgi:Cupredoxin-like domain